MTGYEEQLLTRAEVLEDTGDLVQAVTAVLAGAQGAGVDPAAVTSLQAAVRGARPRSQHRLRRRQPARPAARRRVPLRRRVPRGASARPRTTSGSGCGRWSSSRSRRLAAQQTGRRPRRPRLAAAYAMPVKEKCDGCHGTKRSRDRARPLSPTPSIAEPDCEAAAEILGPARRAAQAGAGPAAAGPPGPRRGLRAGVRVHPQGRQAARLRPVDRRGRARERRGPMSPRSCAPSRTKFRL